MSSKSTVGRNKELTLQYQKTVTLPASATTEYSDALVFAPDFARINRFITVALNPSAVTGTNLDIGLYGDFEEGGAKVLLKATLTANLTATGLVSGQVDLNLYPARNYYIGWTSDINESANTIDWYAIG